VWKVEDVTEAKSWLADRDLRIIYEYDSSRGNEGEKHFGVH
jgi:hypothetical protein